MCKLALSKKYFTLQVNLASTMPDSESNIQLDILDVEDEESDIQTETHCLLIHNFICYGEM